MKNEKCHCDEKFHHTLDSKEVKQTEDLMKEVKSLNLDVPDEILNRIKDDMQKSEKQAQISVKGGCVFPLFLPVLESFLALLLISSVLTLLAGL